MSITQTFKKHKIEVTQDVEGQDDVITSVLWSMTFEKDGHQSVASGLLEFSMSDLGDDLTPVDEVTDEMLHRWVIEDMGPEYPNMVAYHRNDVTAKANAPTTTTYFDDGLMSRESTAYDEHIRKALVRLGVLSDDSE